MNRRKISPMFCVLAVLTVLPLIGFYVWFYMAADNNGLRIEDISGNPSELNNLTISGLLADNSHKSSFLFSKGKLTQTISSCSPSYLEQFEEVPLNKRNYLKYNRIRLADDAHTENDIYINENNGNLDIITSTDKANLYYSIAGGKKSFIFKTGVVYYSEYYGLLLRYQQKKGSNVRVPVEYAGFRNVQTGNMRNNRYQFRTYNDRIYIYTCTGADCMGTGGVFDITDAYNGTDYGEGARIEQYTKNQIAVLENLAPIDLENGLVQIFGMEIIQDRMFFLLTIENRVVIRPFDMNSLTFLEDIPLDLFIDPEQYKSTDGLPDYSYSLYDSFACFEFPEAIPKTSSQPKKWKSHFCVLDMNALSLSIDCSDNSPRTFWKPSKMLYKDDKLYTLSEFPVSRNNSVNFLEDLRIQIYSQKERLYSGRLISDVSDDIQYRGKQDSDSLYNRAYYNLKLQ